jgi:ankyrin repeat protein
MEFKALLEDNNLNAAANYIKDHPEVVNTDLSEDGSNITPLMIAAAEGDLPLVTALLSHGALYSSRAADGSFPLSVAVYNGHADVVSALLDAGEKPDTDLSDDDSYTTPLIIAASYGNLPLVTTLLSHGALPSSRDKDGSFPLYVAAYNFRADVVSALLDAGADPNTGSQKGTALQAAVVQTALPVVKLLIAKGADVNQKSPKNGSTPLADACLNSRDDDKDSFNVIKTLLEAGADPNEPISNRETPLIRLVYLNRPYSVKLLIQHGADVTKQVLNVATTDEMKKILSEGRAVGGARRKRTRRQRNNRKQSHRQRK